MHKARLVRAKYRERILQPKVVEEVMDVLEDWLRAIWDGTANERVPSFNYDVEITYSDANNLVRVIMCWYQNEMVANKEHWAEQGISEIPDFTKIEGQARIAFAQDLHRVVRNLDKEFEGVSE